LQNIFHFFPNQVPFANVRHDHGKDALDSVQLNIRLSEKARGFVRNIRIDLHSLLFSQSLDRIVCRFATTRNGGQSLAQSVANK
jgi:hypothetical protein